MKNKRFILFWVLCCWMFGNAAFGQGPDTLRTGDSSKVSYGKVDSLVIVVQQSGLPPVVPRAAEAEQGPPSLAELISFSKIFWALVIILAGFLAIRLITSALELWSEKSARQRVTLKGLIPFFRIFGWLLISYFVIEGVFKPPVETLLAVGASLGIAIGFASQDILKNVFAGIVILLDKPFSVGDKIEIGSTYGEVKAIGLRSTRIVTADDSLVAVPNAELMNQSVSNANSGEENCMVVAELWLPIDIDTEKVRTIATESAQVSKYIFLNKPITVLFFNEIKERRAYLKMRLKAYVMDIRYEFAFKSEMTEIVMRELIAQEIIRPEKLL